MTTNSQTLSPQDRLRAMIDSVYLLPMLYAVAKLDVARHLADEPKTADELAAATGAHSRSLYRLLRALASEGVFAENAQGRFELTPLADLLRDDHPDSTRERILWRGAPWRWHARGELLHSVITGQPAFEHVHGMGVFDFLDQDPEAAAIFNSAMTRISNVQGGLVAGAYDFSVYNRVIDVGGGHGALMAAILERFPSVQGAIFDQPDVVKGAADRLHANGLADRCRLIGGSFFESVPAGYDAYIMKYIIHDWNDDLALAILGNCRAAMNGNAELLLVEEVIPPGNDPFDGKLMDITMLNETGGMERTESEYRDLLASAGFRLTRIVPTDEEISVIVAAPN